MISSLFLAARLTVTLKDEMIEAGHFAKGPCHFYFALKDCKAGIYWGPSNNAIRFNGPAVMYFPSGVVYYKFDERNGEAFKTKLENYLKNEINKLKRELT